MRALQNEMIHICQCLYQMGLVAATDGNVSARLPDGRILITPSGSSKGALKARDLVLLTANGEPLRGGQKPSSEWKMHLAVYNKRDDVHAIIHAHPPVATAFAVAGLPLPADVLPEVVLNLGEIPLISYARPGSQELADAVAQALEHHSAALLANHGAITIGATLTMAHQRMEKLEHYARIILHVKQLGQISSLSPEALLDLQQWREG